MRDVAISISPADVTALGEWDQGIEDSVNGTLFHLRRFLLYHGDRFSDSERYLVFHENDQLLCRMSMAVQGIDGKSEARSPYGGSYGGPAFERLPSYKQASELVRSLIDYLRDVGVTRFTMTPPIGCCTQAPMDVFYFALLEQGFVSISREISSVVAVPPDGDVRASLGARARRMAGKAERLGVQVRQRAPLDDFWGVLEATFEKHDVEPTHSRRELEWLCEKIPDKVWVDVAYFEGKAVAGIAHFQITSRVGSSFYLCQDPQMQGLQGLSLLLATTVEGCQQRGVSFFDLGTSSTGMKARPNVFQFKEGFSRIGLFRETFRWEL